MALNEATLSLATVVGHTLAGTRQLPRQRSARQLLLQKVILRKFSTNRLTNNSMFDFFFIAISLTFSLSHHHSSHTTHSPTFEFCYFFLVRRTLLKQKYIMEIKKTKLWPDRPKQNQSILWKTKQNKMKSKTATTHWRPIVLFVRCSAPLLLIYSIALLSFCVSVYMRII